MTSHNHSATCSICNLPFKAASSGVPILAGLAAGAAVGCSGNNCSIGERMAKGALAGALTAVGTAFLESLAQKTCGCSEQGCAG